MTSDGRIDSARIIAVGSELLTALRTDTNSLYLTGRLHEWGIAVQSTTVVGDVRDDLGDEIRHALAHADLVVLTGGLGPTDDDLTRDVIADVLELPLGEDAHIVEQIRARFAARGWGMPDVNRRQALVPEGAAVLANPRGTAPGLWLDWRHRVVVALPGPPRELEPMVEGPLRERLAGRAHGWRTARRILRVAGRSESHVEEHAQPIYSRWREATPPIATTILAAPGQIELHLTVRADTDAAGQAALDQATEQMAEALGRDLYSTDGRTLEQVVGDLLRQYHDRVAVAESCTGGLVTSRLTDVPGSSAYLDLGIVTYSNESKIEILGVPKTLLEAHGAVSEPVALAMAAGARARAGAAIGLGVTGIAGPSGATPQQPVGTVCLAASDASGRSPTRTVVFPGGREIVKYQASQAALDMLRRMLDDRG